MAKFHSQRQKNHKGGSEIPGDLLKCAYSETKGTYNIREKQYVEAFLHKEVRLPSNNYLLKTTDHRILCDRIPRNYYFFARMNSFSSTVQ